MAITIPGAEHNEQPSVAECCLTVAMLMRKLVKQEKGWILSHFFLRNFLTGDFSKDYRLEKFQLANVFAHQRFVDVPNTNGLYELYNAV